MAFIGMPGPMEMMLLGSCGLPVIIVLIVLAMNRSKPTTPPPPCSNCGGWTVPQANYCQWCGKALGTASGNPSG